MAAAAPRCWRAHAPDRRLQIVASTARECARWARRAMEASARFGTCDGWLLCRGRAYRAEPLGCVPHLPGLDHNASVLRQATFDYIKGRTTPDARTVRSATAASRIRSHARGHDQAGSSAAGAASKTRQTLPGAPHGASQGRQAGAVAPERRCRGYGPKTDPNVGTRARVEPHAVARPRLEQANFNDADVSKVSFASADISGARVRQRPGHHHGLHGRARISTATARSTRPRT